MSFRQPQSAIIHGYHFKGNEYTFSVESVLEAEQDIGRLLIKASAGYLLMTPYHTTPKSEQSLSYLLQNDGSRVVHTMVTLLATGSSLVSGTVLLCDPLGEVVILTININTLLTVSGSSLTFNKIKPGEVAFAILKIRQQGANTLVTISTDDQDRFALSANSEELNFVPNLTITPSFVGSYLRIRYTPNKSGRHKANLFISTPYETQTISLQGYADGKSDRYWLLYMLGLLLPQRTHFNERATTSVQKLWLLTVLALGGFACATYAYRCQLWPKLCQSQDSMEIIYKATDTTLLNIKSFSNSVRKAWMINNSIIGNETGKKAVSDNKLQKQKVGNIPRLSEKETTNGPHKLGDQVKSQSQSRLKWHPKPNAKFHKNSDDKIDLKKESSISDLEKELNTKTHD